MGTASEDMARSTHLLVVLATFTFLPLHSAQQSCCKKKIVSGKVADDAGLSGTYTLIEGKTTQESACADGCVYSRDSGNSGDEYCFKVADPGADIQDEECAAVTGTTAAGSQSTLSSDELRNQAQDAANRIKENNEKVVQGEQNAKNAEDAQKAMKDIVEDLEEARKSRGKRQEPATVQPVAKPTDCPGFTDTWKKLLALAAGGVSDDNIDQIKAYIDALKDVDVKNLCTTKAERDDIISNNKDTYDKASSATDTYLTNEQKEVTDLKLKVNDDIKLLKEINQKLEDRNEPPVSTVAVSTYKIDPTVPAGGETTEPSSGGETSPAGEKSTPADGATSMPTSDGEMTSKPPSNGKTSPAGEMSSKPSSDGETSPAGGMTSKPPSDGQTSPSAEMTTKPDGGETSKPPTGGETSPAGGQTSQPPSGGESTPSKPGAVSTAKPQRRSFLERKRSRGSMM